MFDLDGLGRFTYVAMEAAIIGGALLFVVAFHIPILWRHWRALALTTALAVIYGPPWTPGRFAAAGVGSAPR